MKIILIILLMTHTLFNTLLFAHVYMFVQGDNCIKRIQDYLSQSSNMYTCINNALLVDLSHIINSTRHHGSKFVQYQKGIWL